MPRYLAVRPPGIFISNQTWPPIFANYQSGKSVGESLALSEVERAVCFPNGTLTAPPTELARESIQAGNRFHNVRFTCSRINRAKAQRNDAAQLSGRQQRVTVLHHFIDKLGLKFVAVSRTETNRRHLRGRKAIVESSAST